MSIYQHFRKHEHPFVDQVLSWKDQVENNFIAYMTDFLDPREQQMIASLIGNHDEIRYAFFGGTDAAERKRAVIAPFYEEVTEDSFEVTVLEATFPEKFVRIEHRDILGAFMSLGIERKKIGDIFVADGRFQFLLTEDIANYVQMNLTQIKQATIQLKETTFANLLPQEESWIERAHTVSSLRLDILVKEIYRVSRKAAVQFIHANRVKVNFTDVTDPATQLIENDLISVRGYGRSKLMEIGTVTRKDKIRIVTGRLKV